MQEQVLTFYKPQSLYRVPLTDAFEEIKRLGRFKLFLQFIDPRTDQLVEGYFEFFPKPQPSYSGRGFIASHQGLTLRVPSSMDWYFRWRDAGMQQLPQKCGCIVEGEYRDLDFKLGVQPAIRVCYEEI